MMRIWIDLAAPAHVWLFAPIIADLRARGCELLLTARDFGETLPLCATAGLEPTAIGRHGGGRLIAKAGRFGSRVAALLRYGRGRRVDLCVSHNSYALAAAARLLRIPSVTMMDYEFQPANHLSFRLADRIILPAAFDPAARRRLGATRHKVREYDGLKEEVYLAGFCPTPGWREILTPEFAARGIRFAPDEDVLVTVRPPPTTALYHRFANRLFGDLLDHLYKGGARVVLLPRNAVQRGEMAGLFRGYGIVPTVALDGRELVANSDLVVSAGGTMAREAATLGVPAVSLFAGRTAGVDRRLMSQGRLRTVARVADVKRLELQRWRGPLRQPGPETRDAVVSAILAGVDP